MSQSRNFFISMLEAVRSAKENVRADLPREANEIDASNTACLRYLEPKLPTLSNHDLEEWLSQFSILRDQYQYVPPGSIESEYRLAAQSFINYLIYELACRAEKTTRDEYENKLLQGENPDAFKTKMENRMGDIENRIASLRIQKILQMAMSDREEEEKQSDLEKDSKGQLVEIMEPIGLKRVDSHDSSSGSFDASEASTYVKPKLIRKIQDVKAISSALAVQETLGIELQTVKQNLLNALGLGEEKLPEDKNIVIQEVLQNTSLEADLKDIHQQSSARDILFAYNELDILINRLDDSVGKEKVVEEIKELEKHRGALDTLYKKQFANEQQRYESSLFFRMYATLPAELTSQVDNLRHLHQQFTADFEKHGQSVNDSVLVGRLMIELAMLYQNDLMKFGMDKAVVKTIFYQIADYTRHHYPVGNAYYRLKEDLKAFPKHEQEIMTKINNTMSDKGSEQEKLIAMEQALLEEYYRIRKSGPSRLANTLEKFLKLPYPQGLDLIRKYKIRIPHHVNKKYQPPTLTELERRDKSIAIVEVDSLLFDDNTFNQNLLSKLKSEYDEVVLTHTLVNRGKVDACIKQLHDLGIIASDADTLLKPVEFAQLFDDGPVLEEQQKPYHAHEDQQLAAYLYKQNQFHPPRLAIFDSNIDRLRSVAKEQGPSSALAETALYYVNHVQTQNNTTDHCYRWNEADKRLLLNYQAMKANDYFASRLHHDDQNLKAALAIYINTREIEEARDESPYHSFFGRIGGSSAQLKISAAKKLMAMVDAEDYDLTLLTEARFHALRKEQRISSPVLVKCGDNIHYELWVSDGKQWKSTSFSRKEINAELLNSAGIDPAVFDQVGIATAHDQVPIAMAHVNYPSPLFNTLKKAYIPNELTPNEIGALESDRLGDIIKRYSDKLPPLFKEAEAYWYNSYT